MSETRIASVLDTLDLPETTVEKGTILWVINGAHLHLKRDQLLRLSQNEEVDSIIYDSEISLDFIETDQQEMYFSVLLGESKN